MSVLEPPLRRPRLAARVLLCGLGVLSLVACGGGSSTSTTPSTPSTPTTPTTPTTPVVTEVRIPAGEYAMGDHFGFVDPSHPSDEVPIHFVRVNAFYMATATTTNAEYAAFLNDAFASRAIDVRNNVVYGAGGTQIYAFTNGYASYYSIGFDGAKFSVTDFRSTHPVVGVMWEGAVAYCNWRSVRQSLQPCYDLKTGTCDFRNNGYRLPTEAEWEYAARGGHTNPYFNYAYGNAIEVTRANLPDSRDPYEGTDPSTYPWTTPVRFYDGQLRLKTADLWPGAATSYQTSDGANGFGLYDMQGNVWQLVNDWYGQNYYASSPYDNPTGPDSGFIMPDGKPYRGMRGGNWYNGLVANGVNDGHSRVSNRNPSYYRGPQDPNHPWYHVGFRVARNATDAGAF
jgi:formylglycine-generating enzyme required for sulfatase activity